MCELSLSCIPIHFECHCQKTLHLTIEFIFDNLAGKVISKQNLNLYMDKEFKLELLLNTGNFIINKNLIDEIWVKKNFVQGFAK